MKLRIKHGLTQPSAAGRCGSLMGRFAQHFPALFHDAPSLDPLGFKLRG